MHDFRITEGEEEINLIFDIVVDASYLKNKENEEEIKNNIIEEIINLNSKYRCIITIDKEF